MRVPSKNIQSQLESVFRAWGMSEDHAGTTARMMVETDLRGVDSHGISMLPTYDQEFRSGRLNMRPVFKTLREGPAMALIDADASLGHPVSVHAMNLAVDKCRATGVAVVSVFNSHHFGAAGCYSAIAAERGVVGMVTPTVAAGKIKVPKLNHRPVPPGWVVDGDGRAVTDPVEAFAHVFERPEGGITPLGGAREVGGHKGYGLAVMVPILGATLSGASFPPFPAGTVEGLPRLCGGCRQDVSDAPGGAPAPAGGYRCSRRPGGNPWPCGDGKAHRRPGGYPQIPATTPGHHRGRNGRGRHLAP